MKSDDEKKIRINDNNMMNIEEQNAIMRPINKESQIVVNSSQKIKKSHDYGNSRRHLR